MRYLPKQAPWRQAAEVAYVLAASWILVTAVLLWMQTFFVYPGAGKPQFDPADRGMVSMKAVKLTTDDGLELGFWASAPGSGMPSILVFHGNGASAGAHAFMVAPYVKAGYGVVMAEFRGYGGNPGIPGEVAIVMDGRSYLAWMDREWHEKSPVVLGISIGTGAAVTLASEGRASALVLDAPYTSLPDIVWQKMHLWAPRFLYKNVYDSLVAIRSVHVPVVVVHGEADDVIPVGQGKTLYAAAPCKYGSLFEAGTPHTQLAFDKKGNGAALVLSLLADVRAGKAACKER